MSKSLSRQPYSGNPTVRDENGGFENRVLRNKNMRSKSIQTSGDPAIGLEHSMIKVRGENPIGVQQR